MKKKIGLLILLSVILCGCTNVKKLNYEQILATFSDSGNHVNVYRTGYKYYLPRGLQIDSYSLYNEVLSSNNETYYLYVDVVSYYNKKNNTYSKNPNAYYSQTFEYHDHSGYVEINLKENEKYLIEIIYNYAKIEVMVDKDSLNKALLYSISILKNVSYNDRVIENMLGKDMFNYSEEDYNIFNTTSSDSNYLDYDNGYTEEEKQTVHDSDMIN